MRSDQQRRAVAVGVAVVLLGVGVLVGRMTAPGESDSAPRGSVEHPTAPVDGEARSRGAALPLEGPYERSPAGAVTAATAYAVALDGPVILAADRREEAIELVAASDAGAGLLEQFAGLAELLESRLGVGRQVASDPGFVWRAVPAGWQLRDYSPTEAVVAIWGTGVLVMEGRQIEQPRWQTTEVRLRWEDARWKLVGFRSEDGPTPPPPASDGAGLVGRQINAFEPFVYLLADREVDR